MLLKLKTECGYQFTSKLESMFNDIKISRCGATACCSTPLFQLGPHLPCPAHRHHPLAVCSTPTTVLHCTACI